MQKCFQCDNTLRDGAKFCAKCGARQDVDRSPQKCHTENAAEPLSCPKCGKTLLVGSQSCWACGAPLTSDGSVAALLPSLSMPPLPTIEPRDSLIHRTPLVAVVVIVCLAGVLLLAVYMLNHRLGKTAALETVSDQSPNIPTAAMPKSGATRSEPKIAMLHVAGGIPGTQLVVDGKPTGMVGQDGSLRTIEVSPGSHRVQLRRDEYKPRTFELNFSGGEVRTLTGADVALEASSDTPKIATPHVAGAPKPVVRVGMSGWQDPQAWQPDGNHFTRHGGNLCLFKPQAAGTYGFTASMKHGSKLRWVAHVVDEKNYAEFELDTDTFSRIMVTNGKSRELVKQKHGMTLQPVEATLQITITPAGIVQKIQKPDGWAVLDSWMDTALHEGRFGFLVRGRDEVNLSGFSFTGSE